jgi:hypothetical protein
MTYLRIAFSRFAFLQDKHHPSVVAHAPAPSTPTYTSTHESSQQLRIQGEKVHYLPEVRPFQVRLTGTRTPSVSRHTQSYTKHTYIHIHTRVAPTIEDSGGKVPVLTSGPSLPGAPPCKTNTIRQSSHTILHQTHLHTHTHKSHSNN